MYWWRTVLTEELGAAKKRWPRSWLLAVEIEHGVEISPVVKNEEQYEYWVDTLPFYRNVRDEGVVVSE
ncbi:MAG: hypothetical protein ACLU6Y_04645 [Ruminococcus sp.]